MKRRRVELKLTVKEVAVRSGLAPETIYRIEHSSTNPYKVNLETARALAKALNAPLYSLFRGDELSGLGRTPKTGVKIGTNVKHRENRVCSICHLEIPLAYTICQEPHAQRENAAIAG